MHLPAILVQADLGITTARRTGVDDEMSSPVPAWHGQVVEPTYLRLLRRVRQVRLGAWRGSLPAARGRKLAPARGLIEAPNAFLKERRAYACHS
jgi:hypothetical protein